MLNGITYAYTTTVPGFYNPITNVGTLSISAPGATAISGAQGDDIVNNGTVQASGAASVGINASTYGVVTNNGTVGVTGAGSTAVQMTGSFGSLLNYGTISAAPGSYAIQTNSTSVGTLVVNNGFSDGQVLVAAGPYARFENSGWLGSAPPARASRTRSAAPSRRLRSAPWRCASAPTASPTRCRSTARRGSPERH